jgi:hypothetical protein
VQVCGGDLAEIAQKLRKEPAFSEPRHTRHALTMTHLHTPRRDADRAADLDWR